MGKIFFISLTPFCTITGNNFFREPRHLWGSNSPKEWKPIPIEQAEGKEPLEWFRIDRNPTYVQDPYKERMELWDEIYDQFILNENASKQKVEL